MKKTIKKLLTMAVPFSLVFAMNITANAEATHNDTGRYTLAKAVIGEEEWEVEDLKSTGSHCMFIDLKEDGTAIFQLSTYGDGTWEDGVIYCDGDEVAYTMEGEVLTLNMDEEDTSLTMLFAKESPEEFKENHSDAGKYAVSGFIYGEEIFCSQEDLEAIGYGESWLELREDGTFTAVLDEEINGVWTNGGFAYDGYFNAYDIEDDEIMMMLDEEVFIFFAKQ